MKRVASILLWSIIAAAFIGPGTVTTAASAGARFGPALLWALVFSTLATLVLQEASGRVAVASGLSLGAAIRSRFAGGSGAAVLVLVLGAIVFGCAAYEAGNILGGVAGAILGTGGSKTLLTVTIGVLAGLVLWFGTTRGVAYFLSVVVALMGIAFLVTAFKIGPPLSDILKGSFVPVLPSGSGLLVLGLIGTTVVPYNLFLGSGLARGQSVEQIRFGLAVSVGLGGVISMGVLVVGTAVVGEFSYDVLATALSEGLGPWARLFFAMGLFAAGFSSAITAPLAAALTARGLFERHGGRAWHERSTRYRLVWGLVLITGVVFGVSGVRPVPAIILAQALNGLILPFIAVFLLIVVNDRSLMGERYTNGALSNAATVAVVIVTVFIGTMNVLKAFGAATGINTSNAALVLGVAVAALVATAWPVVKSMGLARRRR